MADDPTLLHHSNGVAEEHRVAALRDDVARILHELERRFERLVDTPRRLEERTVEFGASIAGTASRNAAALLLGASLVAGWVSLAYFLRARRQRRLSHRFKLLLARALEQRAQLERALPAWLP